MSAPDDRQAISRAESPFPSGRITLVTGRGIPVRGDDIDTDRVIPARFLRCLSFDGLGAHAFEDDRRALAGRHPFDLAPFQGAEILVVNRNFGCGSSREHAPQSLLRWGIRAIVGESFAEIFLGNCVALGIPCVTLAGVAAVRTLQDRIEAEPQLDLKLDVAGLVLEAGRERLVASMAQGARHAFLNSAWDSSGLLLAAPEEVDKVVLRLPYARGWN